MKRSCIICGARVRNINPKADTCSSDCTAKKHNRKEPERYDGPTCKHCGVACSEDEGIVCNACYSQYTPGMLADMEP